MNAPTEEEQDQALADLAGSPFPPGLDRDVARLALIARARGNGMPWAAVGSAFGIDGKTAKARAKKLARSTRRQLAVQARGPAADHDGPYEHVLGDTSSTLNYTAPG